MPRAVQWTLETSTKRKVKTKFARPAKIICQAVALRGSAEDFHFFERTDPSAQLNAPTTSANDHHSSRRPNSPGETSFGQIRTTTPRIPNARPIFPRGEIW